MDYKKAGVDIEAGYKAVSLMKEHIASTMRPEVFDGYRWFFRCIFDEKVCWHGRTNIGFRHRWCRNKT